MRRLRPRLVVGAIAVVLLWLGLVLPHLLGSWPQVLVFVGIVVAVAWAWGRVAQVKAPSPSRSDEEAPVQADVVAETEQKLADR